MSTRINLSQFVPCSYVNGPGARAVVWVQGCPIRCPGCFNPHTHSFKPRQLVTVNELARRILEHSGIEGVTYSGGEPFAQAAALAQLSECLRAEGLSIVSYSGYTIEALRASRDQAKRSLLDLLDILIDGPFIQAQRADLLWRGSTNQRVHFLTDRYRNWVERVTQEGRRIECQIDDTGRLSWTGILFSEEGNTLANGLAALGLRLTLHPSNSKTKSL
jgi:anaerobic ribonucleoside-triphosphate reductase activating protein